MFFFVAIMDGEYVLIDEEGEERWIHVFDSHQEYSEFIEDYYFYYAKNLYVYGYSDTDQFLMDTTEIELYLQYLEHDSYITYLAKLPKNIFGEYAVDQRRIKGNYHMSREMLNNLYDFLTYRKRGCSHQ